MGDGCNNPLDTMKLSLRELSELSAGAAVPARDAVASLAAWLHANEDAQMMVCGVCLALVVWWAARALIALMLGALAPLLLALVFIVCFPAVRQPLLGQNYLVAQRLLKDLLLRAADTL